MKTARLEQRVAKLESQYAQILEMVGSSTTQMDWRKVVGMFADDPDIASVHREAQRIRDEDRADTRGAVEDL